MRLYSETGYAVNADGGAEPWEFQFGTELAKAGPTGFRGHSLPGAQRAICAKRSTSAATSPPKPAGCGAA